jgi:hypothetical protein
MLVSRILLGCYYSSQKFFVGGLIQKIGSTEMDWVMVISGTATRYLAANLSFVQLGSSSLDMTE